MHVARREREAVDVADNRDAANLHVDVQVADQPAHDGELLRILLPEECHVGRDDVEELRADGRHAPEVSRAPGPFEILRRAIDLHPRRVAIRVELVNARREAEIDAGAGRQTFVVCFVAGVAGEIRRIAELAGVDEHAGDDDVAGAAGGVKQRHMSRMERAHRRHERDRRSAAVRLERAFDLGDRADRLHGRVAWAMAR